jgi:hypothetical protein
MLKIDKKRLTKNIHGPFVMFLIMFIIFSLFIPKFFFARQYEVTSQFANRGFTVHTGNIKITCMRLPHANGGHYEQYNSHRH